MAFSAAGAWFRPGSGGRPADGPSKPTSGPHEAPPQGLTGALRGPQDASRSPLRSPTEGPGGDGPFCIETQASGPVRGCLASISVPSAENTDILRPSRQSPEPAEGPAGPAVQTLPAHLGRPGGTRSVASAHGSALVRAVLFFRPCGPSVKTVLPPIKSSVDRKGPFAQGDLKLFFVNSVTEIVFDINTLRYVCYRTSA